MTGIEMIAAERERQINTKGRTPEHDDTHRKGELLDAGIGYIRASINIGHPAMLTPPKFWPWEPEDWKPSDDRITNLVKAGALLAAEIDRLQRLPESPYEWWVFSTALTEGWLMLFCDKTGSTGSVRDPSRQEWSEAFTAPSNHYRWHDESRVHID